MANTERGLTSAPRVVTTPGVVVPASLLVASALHYIGGPFFGVSGVLWLLLAAGLGFVLPRWWTLLLAAIPWPAGVGFGLITGRYPFLGDLWQLGPLFSVLIGLIGIGYGWIARRGRDLQRGPGRRRHRR